MTTAPDGREIIPSGEQPAPWYRHLKPIARFLIEERGHLPVEEPGEYGFTMTGDGIECQLTRSITAEDWAAINERFVIPDNIGFMFGYLIRDGANGIDILGFDSFATLHGPDDPVEVVEAEIRKRDGHLHDADNPPATTDH